MSSSYCKIVATIKGKPRPRFSQCGKSVRAYTPKAYMDYERMIASEYKKQGGKKYEGAVTVLIQTHRNLPSSRPKKMVIEKDTFKPDADNICKAVLDALNGVAYADDRQVVEAHIIKAPRMRNPEGTDVMFITVTPM